MGCSSSKQIADDGIAMQPQPARAHAQISGPSGGPQMVPPVYRDATGRPIQHSSFNLTRATIEQALHDMAVDLGNQGVTANVVTVGGAVNTLYLRSREATHDVDFFLATPNAPEHNNIHHAARYANRQVGGALGSEWFNNTTQIMMGSQVQAALAEAAFQQHTIVYEQVNSRGGLRIFAAPWSYAFCGKLNRLCEAQHREYDMADAVVYLHEYLRTHNRQHIPHEEIFQWGQRYRKNVTQGVLRQVNEAYGRKYGSQPIT